MEIENLTEEQIDLINYQTALLVTAAEKVFYEFVKQAWKYVCSAEFIDGYHIGAICEHLQAVYTGEIKRLIINIPPRCSKSSLTTILFPVWVWINSPQKQFLTGSHSQQLSVKHSLASRNVIKSDWYQQYWGDRFKLREDQNQKNFYENDLLGNRMAFSIGMDILGYGGDIIILDDPLSRPPKRGEISKIVIENTNDFISESLMTRFNDPLKSAFVLIMQRLHQNDPTNYLLNSGEKYEHLMLPMEFEEQRRCKTIIFTDPRTKDREILTERFNEEILNNIKMRMGNAYDGQYQQIPSIKGGNIINVDAFKFYNENDLPKFKKIIQSWDTAYKDKQANDYSAGITIGETEKDYYILDVVNVRLKVYQLKNLMLEYYYKWHPNVILIEDRSSGISLIQELTDSTILPIKPIKAQGTKEVRAHAVSPLIDCGKVLIPEKAKWLYEGEGFINQLKHFPKSSHDDMVDALVMGLEYLKQIRNKIRIVRV